MSRHKRLMALFLSAFFLTAGSSLAALAPAASAAPRSATVAAVPGYVKNVTLCLTNSSAFCADVKDSSDVSGQQIWLYNKASANDYHWIEFSQTCPGGTPGGASCFGFADAQNSNLCMGMNASKNVILVPCSSTQSSWALNSDNHLRSAIWGPAGLLTVAKNANKYKLFGAYEGTAWQKWSGE
jgi:hypothetical protein